VQHQGRRGGHGEDRGDREHRADHEAHPLEQASELLEPVHPLTAALHFLHFRQRHQAADQGPRALRRRDGRVGRHLDRGGQRIARELLGHVGLAAQRALEHAQGLGLGDVAHPLDATHRLDALQEIVELGGRRLVLQVHDDAHPIAPLIDGPAQVEREQPEAAERGERERDEKDRGETDAAGAPQVAHRLVHDEAEH